MTEQTISPDQLPVLTAIPDNLRVLGFVPGGQLAAVPQNQLLAKLIAADLTKATQAILYADLAHPADTVALVYNDADPLKNGWYRKTGAPAAGAWVQFEQLAMAVRTAVEALVVAANAAADRAEAAGDGVLAEISGAGAAAVAVASVYANAMSTTAYTVAYESKCTQLGCTLSDNRGVHIAVLVNGTDVTTGDTITATDMGWACPVGTVNAEYGVYKRNVVAATSAGTLNTIGIVAADTLVATFLLTPAALGITLGYIYPILSNLVPLGGSFTIEAGHDYVIRRRNLDAGGAVLNCAWNVTYKAAGSQRKAGGWALTATPTVFVNGSTGLIPSITLYKNEQKTLLPATDIALRMLIDNHVDEVRAAMNDRNLANLQHNAVAYPLTQSVVTTMFGDSLRTTGYAAAGFQIAHVMADILAASRFGPELWRWPADRQTVVMGNSGGTSGGYTALTRTMINGGGSAAAGFPTFAFNLGMIAGRIYSVHGRLSGTLAKVSSIRLHTAGSANNVAFDAASGIFTGTITAGGASLQFVTNLGISGSGEAIVIESISIREVLCPDIHMNAVGGEQMVTQITPRVNAATAAEKAGVVFLQGGRNDITVSTTPAAILASYATAVSYLTSATYTVATPWMSGPENGSITGRRTGTLRQDMLSTYGAKCLDYNAFWARFGSGFADSAEQRRGAIPASLSYEASPSQLHHNSAGAYLDGMVNAAIGVAYLGGAPFVHDDLFIIKNGDAAGTVIGTPRVIGTGYNFTILSGNEDGAIQINRTTGQITRTALPVLMPFREVHIEGGGPKGQGWNGRIIILQREDGNRLNKPVLVRANGASLLQARSDFAHAGSTEMTIVLAIRKTAQQNATMLAGGNNYEWIGQTGYKTRFTARNAAGASLGTVDLEAEAPSLFNLYTFSINTVTGAWKARVNLETVVTGVATAGTIDLGALAYFFSAQGNTNPWAGHHMATVIYPAAYDIADNAVVNTWWDNATRQMKDIGADGTASAAFTTPLWYIGGLAGSLIKGVNRGNAGALLAQTPLSWRDAGFVDLAA